MLGTYFEYKRCRGRMISEDGGGLEGVGAGGAGGVHLIAN